MNEIIGQKKFYSFSSVAHRTEVNNCYVTTIDSSDTLNFALLYFENPATISRFHYRILTQIHPEHQAGLHWVGRDNNRDCNSAVSKGRNLLHDRASGAGSRKSTLTHFFCL